MLDFHNDRKRYFDIQVENAKGYVIPFIKERFPIKKGMRVLEIGCGEGGVLKAFIDEGCTGVGVEMDTPRIDNAAKWMTPELTDGRVRFVGKDIYQADVNQDLHGAFDIIVLKDVIEHIHDQPKLIARMKDFLKPDGVIFFGFPPWQMPFGGHQQICERKWLARLPWYHLLPKPLYKKLFEITKEPYKEALLEIHDTQISIERFERITKQAGYNVVHQLFYFINPIYKWKFGLKARKQNKLVAKIPWVRNFVTTCVYYLVKVK